MSEQLPSVLRYARAWREKALFPIPEAPELKLLILALAYVNLLLPVFNVSNSAPMLILGLIGLGTYFFQDGNKFSRYAMFCLTFLLALLLQDRLLFPTHGVQLYRSLITSFFSGAAIYYALKQDGVFYPKFLAGVALILALAAITTFAVMKNAAEKFFDHNELVLFSVHHHFLGYIASVICVVNMVSILDKSNQHVILPDNNFFSRYYFLINNALNNRLLHIISFIISTYILFMTYSRTAIFAFLITALFIMVYWLSRRFNIYKTAIISCLCLFIFFTGIQALKQYYPDGEFKNRILTALTNPIQEASFRSRLLIWLASVKSIESAPVIGNGPHTFNQVINEYIDAYYIRTAKKFGREVIDGDTSHAQHAYNQFLSMTLDQGLIILFMFFSIVVYPLRQAVKYRSCFGLLVPLLTHFIIYSLAESPFVYTKSSHFPVFIIFSGIGYFACMDFRHGATHRLERT